jgi:hypothetical protein
MKDKDIERNTPADEGSDNDPNIRDYSGQQPGTNTISKSDTDDLNQHITKTTGDSFRPDTGKDKNADPTFDEDEG